MRFLRRLSALIHRRRFDAELAEEIQFHLDQTTPAQFGNATSIKETTREMFAFTALESIWRDLRHGVRSLRRNPMMFLVAVISLGIGIGAVSTIYSLVDTLLIHDVTAREPERLVRFNAMSYATYKEMRESGVFADLSAWNIGSLRWREGEQTHEAIAHHVTANFFEVLGIQAARGRVFTSAEAAAEKSPRVVVISHRFWQRRLEADPNVIGRTLSFNNVLFTVIGVLPASYRSVQGIGVHPEVFIPFSTALQPNLFDPMANFMYPVGRLNPGRTREQTQQLLKQTLTPVSGLARTTQMAQAKPILAFSSILGVVVFLVFLIACANVAGLLLARGVARRREISVRLAIGAARIHLIRQFLIESALVAAASTLAGIAFTFWAAGLLTNVVLPGMPVAFDFSPDWRLAGAAAALGAVATILSGLIPAFACSRPDLAVSLRSSRAVTSPRAQLRSWLAGAQIAVSVILLLGAFLFVRNLVHVLHFDPGFDAAHTVWFDIVLDHELPPPERIAMRDRAYRDLAASPGVGAVSWAWYLPFNIEYAEPLLRRADGTDFQVTEQGIGPGYLRTMNIPLLEGREFDRNDLKPRGENEPWPVVINQAFARTYFQDGDAVGARLVRIERDRASDPVTVIGISANTSFRSPGEAPVPLLQSLAPFTPNFVVRVAGVAATAAPELSRILKRNAPGAEVGYFTSLERLDRGTWPARAATVLLGVLGAIGLVLALTGLCGVSIYNVTRRVPEIGIRMALGATAGNVLRMLVRDGLIITAAGAVGGLVLALPLTRLLNSFLAEGISPWDPFALAAMLATLFVTAMLSIWLPSRRAARVDPAMSLRCD